jgi:hypothetical protein
MVHEATHLPGEEDRKQLQRTAVAAILSLLVITGVQVLVPFS